MGHMGAERPAYALGGTRLGKRVTEVTARLRLRAPEGRRPPRTTHSCIVDEAQLEEGTTG
jgi:hypothetical protein